MTERELDRDDGDVSDEADSLVGDVAGLPDDVRDGDISEGEEEPE